MQNATTGTVLVDACTVLVTYIFPWKEFCYGLWVTDVYSLNNPFSGQYEYGLLTDDVLVAAANFSGASHVACRMHPKSRLPTSTFGIK